jgi:flagellum-specific peptidoglycan hydrolase FlgJ
MRNIKFILTLIMFLPLFTFAQSEEVEEYISEHYQFAQEVDSLYGIPASICLAQAILESAYGESVLCKMAKNHFGIRDGNKWRKYKNAHESYMDYGLYFKVTSVVCEWPYGSGPKRWAEVLTICRYAGDVPEYGNELMLLIKQYNLTQYDRQI